MAAYNQNLVFNGLGTLSITVPVAGTYFVSGNISIPTISTGSSPSSCLVVINKNGSPVFTGNAGDEGFYANFVCAAADVVAVVFSSSAAVDQLLNVIKSTISIGLGM